MSKGQESTELVVLPAQESALNVYSIAGGLDPLIKQITDKVTGTAYDMSTAKGRDECRSDAAKVGRSKMAIEKLGKALSAEYKEIPKKIDAERRRAFDELEALQAKVRQPLTDWEQAEERRVQDHKDALSGITSMADGIAGMSAEDIRSRWQLAESIEIGEAWEEFETEAHRAKSIVLDVLTKALSERQEYEADQAELAELRRKQAEQDQKDRDAEIARKAAEQAKREAEEKARAERDAAAKREADAKAAQERAEQERLEAIERQKQAEERAETERLAAEQRAKEAAEAARQEEIQRQADEAARIEAEAKAREENRAHKSKIMRAAKEGLMKAGIAEDQAKEAVKLIVAGKVKHVSIQF